MNGGRVAYRQHDGYELLHVATTLLGMAIRADREARARRGAAEYSRRLAKRDEHVEEFEAFAVALEGNSARVAACARRLRQTAQRLTGISAWTEARDTGRR